MTFIDFLKSHRRELLKNALRIFGIHVAMLSKWADIHKDAFNLAHYKKRSSGA